MRGEKQLVKVETPDRVRSGMALFVSKYRRRFISSGVIAVVVVLVAFLADLTTIGSGLGLGPNIEQPTVVAPSVGSATTSTEDDLGAGSTRPSEALSANGPIALTGMLDPAPHRMTTTLAGRQTPSRGYRLYPKGCSESSIDAQTRLKSNYSTLQVSFALDEAAGESVRTSLVVSIDGIAQEPRILSATTGTSVDLDVAGKNVLTLTLSTLGTSDVDCVDAGYNVRLSGNLFP